MILRVDGLTKSFGGSLVLDDVSLGVPRNCVVGVVGENGAGKSTLFNLISGITRPDRGRIEINGVEIRPANYREASLLGISRVFQEQALIQNLPVYENVLLSHESGFVRCGQILDKRRMISVAQRVLDAFGLNIDVRRRTRDYDFSIRQSIEIARACLVPREVLGIEAPIILLDEPTSALAKSEEEALFRLIRRIRQHGSVVFVSHRLSEVLSVCDVVYVLKDGRVVAKVDPADTDELVLHGLMVGRERDSDYYHENDQPDVTDRAVVLAARGLSLTGTYGPVTLEVREGEVLGIGGLLDSGKSHLGKGIAGLVAPDAGFVEISGGGAARPEFRRLIAQGLAYLPSERLTEGIIAPFSIASNLSLAGGEDIFSTWYGYWRTATEEQMARRYIKEMDIKAGGPDVPCASLSGGNQQKVVLAKWLCRSPRVMILDNPTRGIDAGAKEEVYRLIRQLTASGTSILLITDELLELIGLSNRIAIMRGGHVAAMLDAPPGTKPSERQLVALMLGA